MSKEIQIFHGSQAGGASARARLDSVYVGSFQLFHEPPLGRFCRDNLKLLPGYDSVLVLQGPLPTGIVHPQRLGDIMDFFRDLHERLNVAGLYADYIDGHGTALFREVCDMDM